ncbi:peptidase domain-containing ABC transporter [Mesorhizobium sp. BE184]|uniref:peptidase domain-containing ABC transporter n=1 Tax=Mesorhizobium sp. BE184 TaxID=2817714 RepID=UPI0028558D9B|nr:peptidase domain-containing ABC transporter [Mesorhizobium sp. BE184]MDR7033180.1 ATP-binding cassette subfamily B protein RaxB [Mesorhizobium sp. BE184]
MTFFGKRGFQTVFQSRNAECGLACLTMIARYHGQSVDLATLRQTAPMSNRGMSLRDLIDAAPMAGLACRPVRCDLAAVKRLRLPAILHWRFNHFVVVTKVDGDMFEIHDPALGPQTVDAASVSRAFTGIAVELEVSNPLTGQLPNRGIGLADLWRLAREQKGMMARLAFLSLFVQALELSGPLFFQLLIDRAVLSQSIPILLLITGIFCGVAFFSAFARYSRSGAAMRIIRVLDLQLSAALSRRLMALPFDFFLARSPQDILQRIRAIRPVRELASAELVETIFDAIGMLVLSVVIILYSFPLWLVMMLFSTVYLAVKLSKLGKTKNALRAQSARSSSEAGLLLENVQGVESVKLFTAEELRHVMWRNTYEELSRVDIELESYRQTDSFAGEIVITGGRIICAAIAALLVIEGTISIGMLLAIAFLQAIFFTKVRQFIDRMIDIQKIQEHLDEMAEIIDADPEPHRLASPAVAMQLTGQISVRDLSFRYSERDPLLFQHLSFDVGAGESFAITGSSGCGKSTLLRIMTGLVPPVEGAVTYDGMAPSAIGLLNLRRQLGTVLQNDSLFIGTLFQNISMFDSSADEEWVNECARLACAHEFISRMPMNYNSVISDTQGGLSGGERQRVLLARALYKRPRILLLDESSSHLDAETERQVNEALRSLTITRVLVAHREETIKLAQNRIVLGQWQAGRPVEAGGTG